MGRFFNTLDESNGATAARPTGQAHVAPKAAGSTTTSPAASPDNRPLNALPAVTLTDKTNALEDLERPLLPKEESTISDQERILTEAALAAAAAIPLVLAAGMTEVMSAVPDVEALPPRDQSPLHLRGEEAAKDAADPFADIYEDFKQRELSPEPTGHYMPLKGNDTASPVRYGGYGTAPSPLTARGITRPPVHERGALDPIDSATTYELFTSGKLPAMTGAGEGATTWNSAGALAEDAAPVGREPFDMTNNALEVVIAQPLALVPLEAVLGLEDQQPQQPHRAAPAGPKKRYLRRGGGLTAAAAATSGLSAGAVQARRRDYDPFAVVDAALAELGSEGGKSQRGALVRTVPQQTKDAKPPRHWGYEDTIVQQPDIDQAPNYKRTFANIRSKVNRRQRCFLSTAERDAKTIEMPDFSFAVKDGLDTNIGSAPATKRNSFRSARRNAAVEGSEAFRGIDELLLHKKPLRHWGYEAAIVQQPDIDQAPNYKKSFPRALHAGKGSTMRLGAHRGGVMWFVPIGSGILRSKGGLAWVVDTSSHEEAHNEAPSQAPVAEPQLNSITTGPGLLLLPAAAADAHGDSATLESPAAVSDTTAAATAIPIASQDQEEPHYWRRTDSTVSSSLNETAEGNGEVKKKHKSGLKKLVKKITHSFRKHKEHKGDKEAATGAGVAPSMEGTTSTNQSSVRTAQYPLGLPVAPCVEKKRMKQLKNHGMSVPLPKHGDQRTDPAFEGPQRVTCAELPTTPQPVNTLSPSAFNYQQQLIQHHAALSMMPAESPATAAISADPAVIALGPKAGPSHAAEANAGTLRG